MPRNGSGTYTVPNPNFVPNTIVDSSQVNNNNNDIADALTSSLAKDGQTVPTANLPMGGYKHTGVADGAASDEYATYGQLTDIAAGVFNVATYGATGDGVTDDAAAIKAALAAASAFGGGIVVVPPGTYKVDGAVHLTPGSNTHIVGSLGAIIKPAVTFSDSEVVDINNKTYVTVENLHFDMTLVDVKCIRVFNSSHIKVRDCSMVGTKVGTETGQLVQINSSSAYVEIDGVYVDGGGGAVDVRNSSNDIQIRNFVILNTSEDAINFTDTDAGEQSKRVIIENGYVENTGQNDPAIGIQAEGAGDYESFVINNVIAVGDYTATASGGTDDLFFIHDVKGFTLTNCIAFGAGDMGYGIQRCDNWTISNCVAYDCESNGIGVISCTNGVITGGSFVNNLRDETGAKATNKPARAYGGIRIEEECDNILVTGVTCKDTRAGGSKTQDWGIILIDDLGPVSTNITIGSDCQLEGNNAGPVYIESNPTSPSVNNFYSVKGVSSSGPTDQYYEKYTRYINDNAASGTTSEEIVNRAFKTTLDSAASTTDVTLTLADASGMTDGDIVLIKLDDLSWHASSIASTSAPDITIDDALPSDAASGKPVLVFQWRRAAIWPQGSGDAYPISRATMTVHNATGSAITDGQVVYLTGTWNSGTGAAEVDLAKNNSAGKTPAIGIAWNNTGGDIDDGSTGTIITHGYADGLDTSAFSDGDSVFVSFTAGELTTTEPSTTSQTAQRVGQVVRADASDGVILWFGTPEERAPTLAEDNKFAIVDNSDNTRELRFQCNTITSGNERVVSAPDHDVGYWTFAAGIHDWAGGAATTDSISVTGLEATDVIICQLVARAGSEVLELAANDAGNDQIDLTLSVNGTDTTTKISYQVLRPTA